MALPATGIWRGVIEGFYGRSFDWRLRRAYVDFLATAGLNSYLYCPKSDDRLRRHWQQPWEAGVYHQLLSLSQAFAAAGLCFGIGLSPYALYRAYGPAERDALRRKLDEIAALQPGLLAILFDDMPGDQPDLAARQSDILQDVRDHLPQQALLTCPTYYTPDPVLERHFGPRPEHYWAQFGAGLPTDTAVLWTGPRVCSEQIGVADVAWAVAQLGSPIVLWDNYPVNDGALRSRHLYTSALQQRPAAGAAGLAGHLCNLMNQGWLSMLALQGLAEPGRRRDAAALFGEPLAILLARDAQCFEQGGLVALTPTQREVLADEYARLDHPAAAEIVDWLRGAYAFDPACLTD